MSEALEEVPKLNILLAATGSVATVKVPVLVDEILSKGHRVKVVLLARVGDSMNQVLTFAHGE